MEHNYYYNSLNYDFNRKFILLKMIKLWGFYMKYKYIILFCTIMILSISTVSAADNTTEDIQIDDTTGDLMDLQTLIYEDTSNYVNLTGNYVGDSNNKTVVINKNITIDGNGYTIDYLSNKPIFDIQASDILIKNLTIIRHNTALGQKTVFTGEFTESNPMVQNCSFLIDNALPTIFANNLTKNYKNSTQFYATIVDANNQTLANTTVTFYVNGVYYNRTTDSNGRAKLNINLSPGNYIITSTNTVTNETRQNIIEVLFGKSGIIAYNLYKYCKDDSKPFYATPFDYDGNPLANVTVTFYVNGVYYNRTTDSDGRAKLNINLLPGEYNITSTNTVTGQSTSNLIRVMSPFVEANDLIKKYNTDTQFKVKLVPDWGAGETVTFHVNGVSYNRTTDVFCVAALNINLMPGQYIIASTTNNYTIYNTITVLYTTYNTITIY